MNQQTANAFAIKSQDAAAAQGDRSTHFLFSHKLFATKGGYFSISPTTEEPVFNFKIGRAHV